jgi:hypothetical protein
MPFLNVEAGEVAERALRVLVTGFSRAERSGPTLMSQRCNATACDGNEMHRGTQEADRHRQPLGSSASAWLYRASARAFVDRHLKGDLEKWSGSSVTISRKRKAHRTMAEAIHAECTQGISRQRVPLFAVLSRAWARWPKSRRNGPEPSRGPVWGRRTTDKESAGAVDGTAAGGLTRGAGGVEKNGLRPGFMAKKKSASNNGCGSMKANCRNFVVVSGDRRGKQRPMSEYWSERSLSLESWPASEFCKRS